MGIEQKVEQLKKIIEASSYLVCICEKGMLEETGYKDLEYSDTAYDVEEKYGYATEEIFNSAFYATRKEQFFDFYKTEILSADVNPNDGYKVLKVLEDRGKLKSIITTGIYSLPQRVGCKSVIELHGNINSNECPHCHKKYTIDFMKNNNKVPLCTECGSVVRPGVYLYGEMLDNSVMTSAMQETERADVLMICGSSFNGLTCTNCVQYFNGNKIVLINREPNYADSKADLVIYGEVSEILSMLV
ncbi:MAG: NAD-dependent deacetylase [Lachnospiraceae bacterium]|nr:NAD-dependent deacetylase [Lachnospiraceae bacterium]